MRQADFSDFTTLLDCIAELLGKPSPSPAQAGMFFRVLADYPLETVRAALDAHLRDPNRGRFFPAPADVIAKIEEAKESASKRPTADEAWAISIKARDEADTVVWTEEMAQAWGICKPVMDCGDEVGARMAFRASYERLVADAKREGRPARWVVSEGFDKHLRLAAVQKAQSAGLALGYDASTLAIEYTGNSEPAVSIIPPDVLEKLNAMREAGRESRGEADRRRTAELKRRQQTRVQEYLSQQPHQAEKGASQ